MSTYSLQGNHPGQLRIRVHASERLASDLSVSRLRLPIPSERPVVKKDPRNKIRKPDCELCPLHEEAEHVCLMGSGPTKTKIMIVGEAPGKREDDEHRAFTGPAGKLLDKLLEEKAELLREDCYVTNVVKCRPPRNRTPDKAEIKTCVDEYFHAEMKMVEPDFVLSLGNPALYGVLKKGGITKHRGNKYQKEDYIVMPTFHPAAVLRNPKYTDAVEADFEKFGQMVREEDKGPVTRVKLVETLPHLKWLMKMLHEVDGFSYDIETNQFHEWRPGAKIVSISFTWEDGQAAVLPLWHAETPWPELGFAVGRVLATLAPVCRSKGKHVAHNGKFDARWMKWFNVPIKQTFDTMLAAHMLDENRLKGLKPLSEIELGADAYDLGDEIKDAFNVPLKRLAIYNGKDTDYTHRLHGQFRRELIEHPRIARVFMQLMMPASNALVDIEQHGIQVDWERWKERSAKVEGNCEKLEKAMKQHMKKSKRADFNFQSHPQIAAWLFDELGIESIEETKGGAKSSKESVLLQLRDEHRAAALLLKHRKWNKYRTTYIGPWAGHVDGDHRMHPVYKLFGTVTGRLSCVEPNLQQVPREPFIRSIIGARPGYVVVEADYSQIELRIAAMLAHERRMLRMFAEGEDLHMNTAVETTGKPASKIKKEERKKAKAVNFGFLYGMGAKKFVEYARDNYEVVVTEAEAERVRRRFFESYPQLLPWHDRQRRLAHRYGRVSSPLGRVRHLTDIKSSDRNVQADAERQAINSPVQSTASDLMLAALIMLHLDSRARKDLDFFIIGSIHDALLFEVHEDHLDKVLPLIRTRMLDMDRIKRMFGAIIDVPIEVEIKVSSHWSEPGAEIWTP